MILLDNTGIQIEELEQILIIESCRIRCLIKQGVIEVKGTDFHVSSLSDHDLTVKGKVMAVELNER
ncbi:MAG: YabP/YqfC family sporulation protein [Erysipelotrichaceae bacterium]|nr:YabP/YqfC family sporulation protein [Erysipelotrichaceae bacterium]